MNVLGDIRPSQLLFTFGVGSLLDLPNVSAIVMGLDDWDTRYCREITEDRLVAALQRRVGAQMSKLYLPPVHVDDFGGSTTASFAGVPVCAFPRWLRCPVCDTMATVESGVFQLQPDRYRPDRTRYVHVGCTKATNPTALAVRFLLACREGHLTDFPWIDYVHAGIAPCKPSRLTFRQFGASGDASDIIVKCRECNRERRMADAFDSTTTSFKCPGHHPHLRILEQQGCKEPAKTILLGASNSWFPILMSALSIPREEDKLAKLVEERWVDLKDIPSLDVVRYVTAPSRMPAFAEFTADQIWNGIQAKRARDSQAATAEPEDLKTPEWEVLSAADSAKQTSDFRLRKVAPPIGFERYFEDTVLVERIREVRALVGFNRIESNGDFTDATIVADSRRAPLSRSDPTWLPASEVRGEGIFIRLREGVLTDWESQPEIRSLEDQFFDSHRAWRRLRKLSPEQDGFPAIRYILLHSVAHALMRQIVLDCGYTAASIRERIYSKAPADPHGPMAGFLIYTSATDSEGTLGGLVDLGKPISMARHLQQTLENLRICASDPLCSEHRPSSDGRGIHAASCHACLFAPETSCERGNRYLDRCCLISTISDNRTAFFEL